MISNRIPVIVDYLDKLAFIYRFRTILTGIVNRNSQWRASVWRCVQ